MWIHASGTASIIEIAPGRYHLRLDDFSVRNGPDLFVYLSPEHADFNALMEALRQSGMRTLVIDLDTQANASLLIFGNNGDEHLFEAINDYMTISDWLLENFFANEQRRLGEFITTDASDVSFKGKPLPLDLIPSSPRLRKTS